MEKNPVEDYDKLIPTETIPNIEHLDNKGITLQPIAKVAIPKNFKKLKKVKNNLKKVSSSEIQYIFFNCGQNIL